MVVAYFHPMSIFSPYSARTIFLDNIIIIIIIIMSCRQHRYPWPSLATSPYHSSLLAGLQGYIPYPHIAAVCMFELVVLLLLGHMRGPIGVQNGENPPNYHFLRTFRAGRMYFDRSLHSSRITTPWGKLSNLWTSWVYSLRPMVPSWTWIGCT